MHSGSYLVYADIFATADLYAIPGAADADGNVTAGLIKHVHVKGIAFASLPFV